jgi:hypothetical protein
MEKLLHTLYFNSSSPAYMAGLSSLLREAKLKNPKITKPQVEKFLQKYDAYTLHKPRRRTFPRNRVIPAGLDTDWQADLIEMGPFKKQNKNFRYILTCIDVLSKFAWAIPLKSKHSSVVNFTVR